MRGYDKKIYGIRKMNYQKRSSICFWKAYSSLKIIFLSLTFYYFASLFYFTLLVSGEETFELSLLWLNEISFDFVLNLYIIDTITLNFLKNLIPSEHLYLTFWLRI